MTSRNASRRTPDANKPLRRTRAAGASKAAPSTSTGAPTPEKAKKAEKHGKRQKPVRDSFTMPAADFALIAVLKERALSQRREAKKSELLRAGLHALDALDATSLVSALDALMPVKTGRPKKGH